MDLQVEIDSSGDALQVKLRGSLSEFSEEALSVLHKYAQQAVTINFADLEQLNSSGVRVWTFFLGPFAAKRRVTFTQCPEIMVSQFAMIPQVSKGCEVISVIGRFRCDHCHKVYKRLYDLRSLRQAGELLDADAPWPCSVCGQAMETLEDETFFDFINEGLDPKGITA